MHRSAQYRSAVVLLAIMLLTFSLGQRTFLSVDNFVNIAIQTSLLGMMTIGLAFTVITGNLDLSVGSVAAVAGIVFASLNAWPLLWAMTAAVFVGLAMGAVNGFLVGRLHLNSIVVTLGGMAFGEGLALWLSRGYPIPGDSEDFEMPGGGFLLHVPLPIVFFAACAVVAFVLLRQTQWGRDLYAIGDVIELARLCEVPVSSRIMSVYILSSGLSAFAGVVLASRLNTASPLIGQDAPLQALVAIVIGGVRLSGGQGGIGNVVLGLADCQRTRKRTQPLEYSAGRPLGHHRRDTDSVRSS